MLTKNQTETNIVPVVVRGGGTWIEGPALGAVHYTPSIEKVVGYLALGEELPDPLKKVTWYNPALGREEVVDEAFLSNDGCWKVPTLAWYESRLWEEER